MDQFFIVVGIKNVTSSSLPVFVHYVRLGLIGKHLINDEGLRHAWSSFFAMVDFGFCSSTFALCSLYDSFVTLCKSILSKTFYLVVVQLLSR